MDRVPEKVTRRWRDHICDHGGAGRFLSPLGSGVAADAASAMPEEDLEAFLAALRQTGEEDPIILAEALDLARTSYSEFFIKLLPGLLESLANERVVKESIVGPYLQGRPDWERTALGRRTGSLAPTDFYSRLPMRSFSLPENQLVCWLVASVVTGIGRIEARTNGRLPPAIRALQVPIIEAIAHPWFSQIEPPPHLEAHMLACAERQRISGYREAAVLAEARARLTSDPVETRRLAVLDLLRVNWLAPVCPDDLFELYVLVLVLDALVDALGPPREYGLVTAGREHVARFTGNAEIRVLFDQTPPGAGWSRAYDDVRVRHEGLPASPRRPDIILLREDVPRAVMVEVKRTSDQGYLSESIYKGFGYLADFADLWVVRPGKPQLLIVLPEGQVRPREDVPLDVSPMVVCAAEYPKVISQAVLKGLGL